MNLIAKSVSLGFQVRDLNGHGLDLLAIAAFENNCEEARKSADTFLNLCSVFNDMDEGGSAKNSSNRFHD